MLTHVVAIRTSPFFSSFLRNTRAQTGRYIDLDEGNATNCSWTTKPPHKAHKHIVTVMTVSQTPQMRQDATRESRPRSFEPTALSRSFHKQQRGVKDGKMPCRNKQVRDSGR